MNDQLDADDTGKPTVDDTVVNDDVVVDDNKPDDFRGHEDQEGLLKGYDELKAGQAVVPESIDDYTFDEVEGIEIDNDAMAAAKEHALKEGIPTEYFKKFVAFDLARAKAFNDAAPDREKAELEASQAEADKVVSELKAELGAGFDEAVGFQQKAFSDFGIAELKDDPVFANNKLAFKFSVAVGKALSEQKINSGDSRIVSDVKLGDDGRPMMTHKDADKV